MRINLLLLLTTLLLVSQGSNADILQDANRLLRMTAMENHFKLVSIDQTKKIVRTYTSIVNMSAKVSLPKTIKDSITNCYAETYSWENFSDGIAKILVDNLSPKEMDLLIDFYGNRGFPPREIETFKSIIKKAKQIEQISFEYIFKNSGSCVRHDAKLINNFMAESKLIEAIP